MNSQKLQNVQTTVVALLLARKGGCTLTQLSRDYYETEGEHIPWKELGYLSLLNFLQSMPRCVEVEFRNNTFFIRGIASEKSKHVSKLVAGQKDQKTYIGRKLHKPSHYYPNTAPQRVHIPAEILTNIISYVNDHPDGVNKDYILQKVQSHMPHANISMSDMEEQLYKLSHKIHQSHNKIFPVQNKPKTMNHSAIVTASGEEDSDDLLDYEEDDFGFVPSRYTPCVFDEKSPAKTKPTSSFIKETVSRCQGQNTQSRIIEHVSRLQTDQLNFFDSHNYTCNVDDQTQIGCNNVGTENYFESNNVDILINERVKFRLEKLIQSQPNGIWCADLPEKYLQEYNVSLNYAELGFSSVREFASQLPEIFHCVQQNDMGDFMLYYAKGELPLNKQKEKQKPVNLTELHHVYEKDDEAEALPTTLSIDTCKKLIPDGIVTIGECVGQINVADLVDMETPYIEVVVVEVFTPSFFWIQLRKKQKAFKTFMNELHEFYSRTHDQYAIPPVVLEKGLNCTCMYNEIWHRGIIKTVKPDLQVTVMFYDYGTLKTYPPNAIFYLHRMFSSMPAQAIPCGLINTKPYKGSKWSYSATHRFAVRTSQIPLVATIASINIEDNSMMVTLTDTSEDEDVHINDLLVEEKFAQHGKMVCTKNRNFPFRYYLECQKRSKQMSEMSETSKIVQPLRYDEPILFKSPSENKAALYNNSKVCSVSFKLKNKTPPFFKLHDSSKSGSSVEKRCSLTLTSEEKPPGKLKSLYEKLINLKRNSHTNSSSNKEFNNIESYESSSSDLIMNKMVKDKLYEEPSNDNVEGSNKFGKKVNETEKYDVLAKFSNIPAAYAYHFRIQDPEEELDITCGKTHIDTRSKQSEFEEVDWSVIRKNIEQRKECIVQQDVTKTTYKSMKMKRDNIPLAESCFLKAVLNSTNTASCNTDICWLPSGNVSQVQDETPLILKNIKKCINSSGKEKVIAVPQKILELLTEKELPENPRKSLINTSESTNDAQSIRSSQDVSSVTADNSSYSNNDGTFYIESSQSSVDNSESRFENQYLLVKLHSSRYKLLQRLLAKRHVSSDTSHLDSDDLSVSSISASSEKNISNTDERYELEEHENDIRVNESLSNESNLETNLEDFLHSTRTESTSVNTTDSCANSRNNESRAALLTPETSVSSELMLTESVLSEQRAVVEEMLREDSTIEPVRVENEMISSELVPRREVLPPDTVNNKSSVPVVNDIDLESDEEEWDVQMSSTDVRDFLRVNCPFRKSIDAFNQLEQESNACLQIRKINDSDPVEIRNALDEKQENNIMEMRRLTNSVEMLGSIEELNIESENLMDQYEESTNTQRFVSQSEKYFDMNSKDNCFSNKTSLVSCKSQGKTKTLVEMLNKVKLLQKDRTN